VVIHSFVDPQHLGKGPAIVLVPQRSLNKKTNSAILAAKPAPAVSRLHPRARNPPGHSARHGTVADHSFVNADGKARTAPATAASDHGDPAER